MKNKVNRKTEHLIAEISLQELVNIPELDIPLFLLFLVICTLTLAGNILIIVLTVADQHLHTPMYFFLGNLSCSEISRPD